MSQDTHPSDDRLEYYLLGHLAEGEVTAVEEHLLICAACRRRIEAYEKFVRAIRNSAPAPPGED